MSELKCAIITLSDTCSSKLNEDTSGPWLVDAVKKTFADFLMVDVSYDVLPDDLDNIEVALKYNVDVRHVDLIITTGGTGFTKRDVTPEATRKVIHKEAAGISTALCIKSLQITEMAMLSRGVCGIRDNTLIINFPGSLKAVKECYTMLEKILPHALDQIRGDTCQVKKTHAKLQTEAILKPQLKPSHFSCPHKTGQKVFRVAYRHRESIYPMLEVDKALSLIDECMRSIYEYSLEEVKLNNSLNRVLGRSVVAREPFPPFPASTKDGYACISSDGSGERKVREQGVTAGGAGSSSQALQKGECARISTGAPVPLGADCVVQVEDTKLLEHSEDGTVEYKIEVMVEPSVGLDIRQIGSDIQLNETVMSSGTVIGPAEQGLLCSLGVQSVIVYSKPKIGILSTGNELQMPYDEVLRPGHIRDSNKSMLMGLLGEYADCVDLGITKDNENSLKETFTRAFKELNIIVTTGGVSMGEKDLMKNILVDEFNGEIVFGRLNMKPGKPTVFVKCNHGKSVVFALPGNPVSAFVTSHLMVIPSLKSCCGMEQTKWRQLKVQLDREVKLDNRPEYARANFELNKESDIPVATLTGNQISSRLASAVNAQLLVLLPSSLKHGPVLAKGTTVMAMIIGKP